MKGLLVSVLLLAVSAVWTRGKSKLISLKLLHYDIFFQNPAISIFEVFQHTAILLIHKFSKIPRNQYNIENN